MNKTTKTYRTPRSMTTMKAKISTNETAYALSTEQESHALVIAPCVGFYSVIEKDRSVCVRRIEKKTGVADCMPFHICRFVFLFHAALGFFPVILLILTHTAFVVAFAFLQGYVCCVLSLMTQTL
jgi:hypothetical protein